MMMVGVPDAVVQIVSSWSARGRLDDKVRRVNTDNGNQLGAKG